MLFFTAAPSGAFSLLGLSIGDATTQEVVEGYTLMRALQPIRILGTPGFTDWLLDHPPFSATLARYLHPPLERYQITDRGNGLYDVNDLGSLRGNLRLVARGPNRRVYLCQGKFRSLAYLFNLSGNLVFALEYREVRAGSEFYTEVSPLLYLRLDNVLAHGVLKVVAPLIHGLIDRRVANLTIAAQLVGERLTRDPEALYREIRGWSEIRPEDLQMFRQTFLPPEVAR